MRRDEYTGWTPKLVGEQIVAALKWANRAAGLIGPAGIRSSMPAFAATLDDFLEEGWGLPETADDIEAKALTLPPSPAQVSRYLAALQWPADYLIPDYEGSARILGLWAACKALRQPFDRAIKARGTISRGSAYALRDRGLSIISQGLERDGVEP